MIETMRVFENQSFYRFFDQDSGAVFGGIEFRQCVFDNCCISVTHNPKLRSVVRNVRLVDCTVNGGSIDTTIVEDVLIENLKTAGLFQTFGAVFKHVVLRGKIGDLMISNETLPDLLLNRPYQYENVELFRVANAEYYRDVDWALDISQAEFKDIDIRGIPAQLIRRDPDTQVMVTRERALEGQWQNLDFNESLTSFSLKFLIEEGWPDTILVAPKRHRKFRSYLHDLQLLRAAGIAEPD